MKKKYKQPYVGADKTTPQQVLCASGKAKGWAKMDGYGEDTGGGFSQTF